MLTTGISIINFKIKANESKVKKKLISLIKSKNHVISSLSKNYKNSFDKKKLKKYKKDLNYRVIGMGGSTLGTQAIYDFLNDKIKKKFSFIDNLQVSQKKNKKNKKNFFTNLIVSKSDNTIETIINSNILIKKKIKIFLLLKIRKVTCFF